MVLISDFVCWFIGPSVQEDIPCNYMTISDHLDMVGVELYAKWHQTRKINGDQICSNVKDIIKLWKTGKFMYLSLRSWSLNMYCFSKIWFKTHSVDLREADCKQITSLAKSWMYADMLLKPEENILHRPIASGGLGLHHVKIKSVAGLIRSFLETACMPRFRPSLYHQLLFRAYVLEEEFLSVPRRPPYCTIVNSFFSTLSMLIKII